MLLVLVLYLFHGLKNQTIIARLNYVLQELCSWLNFHELLYTVFITVTSCFTLPFAAFVPELLHCWPGMRCLKFSPCVEKPENNPDIFITDTSAPDNETNKPTEQE